jgi:hypothetical protein
MRCSDLVLAGQPNSPDMQETLLGWPAGWR